MAKGAKEKTGTRKRAKTASKAHRKVVKRNALAKGLAKKQGHKRNVAKQRLSELNR